MFRFSKRKKLPEGHDTLPKMTIMEAEQILDIVSIALQEETENPYLNPISALKGYDVFQIDMALKLRIAKEFLILVKKSDFEKSFSEGINLYEAVPLSILTGFVPDDELEKLSKLPPDSDEYREGKMKIHPEVLDAQEATLKDKRFASLEMCSSFGDYCKHIGSEDPLYWQKIYTHIGLKYTSTSPQGNEVPFI